MSQHRPELRKTRRYYEWEIEEVCVQSMSPGGAQFTLGTDGRVWTHKYWGRDRDFPVPLNGRYDLLDELAEIVRYARGSGRFRIYDRLLLIPSNSRALGAPWIEIAKIRVHKPALVY